MDIGKPVVLVGLGVLIWAAYSLVILIFSGFFRDCFRTARELPGRSFLNGAAALGIALLFVFGSAFLLGGNRALFAGGLFMAFQIAGSAVGLVIIGSLGGVIDVEKRPRSALAAGIIISWLVRVFSTDAAEIFNLALAVYGVGAVTLYFRGETPAAQVVEVQPELDMPAGDGELVRRFREKQAVPRGAKAGGGADLLWVMIAVAVIGAMFYAYKNNPALRNIISPGEAADARGKG